MPSLTAALRSSIGKKFVMGLTGLFLCFFLVVHLAGNLLLYVGDGTTYNEYAHKLHATPAFLYPAEFFLYVAFAVHIYLAFATSGLNWSARGDVPYAEKRTKIYNRVLGIQPESMMFFTGAMVFAFTALHLLDFKAEMGWGEVAGLTPYDKALMILSSSTRKVAYALGSLFVGLHVLHGLRSAFQSLGVNHPKYNRPLDILSVVFAIVVGLGFASFTFGIFPGKSSGAAPEAPAVIDGAAAPQ